MKKNRLALLFGLMVFFFAGDSGLEAQSFADIGGRDDRAAIEYLQNNQVVKGYGDGTYKPDQKISRAEFLKIVLKSHSKKIEACTEEELSDIFPDVNGTDWFGPVVCEAKKTQIIEGYPDGNFYPHNTIQLSEAAKIVLKVQEVPLVETSSSIWYKKYLDSLVQDRVIDSAEIENPAKKITRGEMAQMSYRIITGTEVEPKKLALLPEINSCSDLSRQLFKGAKRGGQEHRLKFLNRRGAVMMEDGLAMPMMMEASRAEPEVSSDFSTTNIQEIGVDETDIIKNDGSHIFYARGEDIRIVRAYPADKFEEVAKIVISGMTINQLFLDKNKLVALGYKQSSRAPNPSLYSRSMISSHYYPPEGGNIEMRVFDITDRSDPKEIRKVSLEGHLVDSRRIGDTVYLVSKKYLSGNYISEKELPYITDKISKTSIAPGCGNISYFPNFKNNQLLTIAAIDTHDPQKKITLKNILGAGETVYASSQNLYVIQPNQQQVYRTHLSPPRWDWDEKSDLYKFSLEGSSVDFVASGAVDGRVLNQYSMSEYQDNFRIATQKGHAWGEKESENLVTIFDKALKPISAIRNIALGENLKSARFMGDRAFVVTFKTVDPLFVLDLNPKDPKILGELKIPGWSDYLHPIDDNYLIGFGKEVDETIDADKVHSKNAVYYTAVLGMKLAIFDVSDLENPKEIHKTVIGDRGTESEILSDPKALFYDANRKLIGFPITIQKKSAYSKHCFLDSEGKEICEENHSGDQFETSFSGAQVYNFSVEDGFELKGQVTHFPELVKNYWDPNYKIQRIVRISDNFYSVSQGIIKALDSQLETIKDLGFNREALLGKCLEITDEYACQKNPACKVQYKKPDCPVGLACVEVLEFEKCEVS